MLFDLGKKVCDCREWVLTDTHIPCRHAASCIYKLRKDPVAYTDECYYVTTKMYDGIISPIPDSSLWPKQNLVTILPPLIKKKAGRPLKQGGVDLEVAHPLVELEL